MQMLAYCNISHLQEHSIFTRLSMGLPFAFVRPHIVKFKIETKITLEAINSKQGAPCEE
jgi:hypothetical protein